MIRMSNVLFRALEIAEVAPERIDRVFERRLRYNMGAMREIDHFPRLISRVTGVRVERMRRLNRYLLIEFGRPGFIYREFSRNQCQLILKGEVPDTVRSALVGEPVASLAELGRSAALFEGTVIKSFLPSWEGVTSVDVDPGHLVCGTGDRGRR